jgi:hypothetical protein
MTGLVAMATGFVLVVACSTAVVVLLRPRGWVDRCITWYVVAMLSVLVAVVAVGIPGQLRPGPVLTVQAVQAVVPGVLLLRRHGAGSWAGIRWPRARAVRELLRRPWELALVVLATVALAWELLVALVLPPYAYDALSYHLVNVASWVQQGSFAPPPLDLCCAYYAGNAEVFSAWSAVLLGSDHLVGTVQIAAAAAGGIATAGIARAVGLDRAAAASAGALFVLTPVVVAQAPTAYVDVLQTTFVLCALHGLARFARQAEVGRLLVPALAAAVLSGTKGHGLLWAAAIGITALVLTALHVQHGRLSSGRAVRALAAAFLACAVLGGWWYLRNLLQTGNPLYPFEVRFAGRTILAGPFQVSEVLTVPPGGPRPWPLAVLTSWAADLLPWRHGIYDYQQRAGGLGPLWSWLGVLVVPMVISLWRRRSPALAAVLPALPVLIVQPYPWWARFTLVLAAVGAVAVVWSVQWLQRRSLRRALQAAILGLVLLGTLLTVAAVNPASQARPLPARRVLALVGASERTLGRLFLPEYRFLDEVPATATIVVDLEAPDLRFVYPMFGRGFRRTVVPWGQGPVPDTAWVVSSPGRPLDVEAARSRSGPVSDLRGVRVWAPSG